ncbi:MAG: hypothetical protein MUF61_03005 [archaeon]|jgi:uncharacterized membrane protein|nr:hypothetical protein [archaeon]
MRLKKKVVGYVLSIAGLVIFLYGATPKIQEIVAKVLPFTSKLPMSTVITAGVIIALGGIGLLVWAAREKAEQPKEVPIYAGHGSERKIVGIQRMGKQ